ncbi:MAG TPA: hypothetical protein VHZ07_07290 [Bryobacteraceae bacterium]|jgi:photosystem II stability/assembly factor-like uncharacterized protein|nr:hypothetical protein [Bryobacteraceae bacterium]
MLCARVPQAAGLLLCLAAAAQSPQQAPPPPALSTATIPNTVSAPMVDMQLLTASSGWARTNTNLFFTSTSGRGRTDISPHLASGQRIDAVQFLGTDQAWVIIHGQETGDGAPISLAMTTDGGGSWSVASFPADQLIRQAYGARAHMSFPDAMHGWVLLTIAGSSASSRGHLFATSDGGKTWSPLPVPPVDGRIQFVSESTGWLAGGVHQDYLFRTGDGGQTWLEVEDTAAGGPDTVLHSKRRRNRLRHPFPCGRSLF